MSGRGKAKVRAAFEVFVRSSLPVLDLHAHIAPNGDRVYPRQTQLAFVAYCQGGADARKAVEAKQRELFGGGA